MKELTFSVAMATYNGERFLQEQLDSLARQTLLPFELVACDDGSTDGTLEILYRFAAKAPFPVRIYQNPVRLGCSENFLRAVELCRGELIAFSDQDDVWFPPKLEQCANKFNTEHVVMVIHLALLADSNLEPLDRTWPHLGRFRIRWSDVPAFQLADVAAMTMVFRRKIAEPVLQDPVLRWALRGHDYGMRFLASSHGSVIPLRKVLAVHRCHDTNLTASHSAGAAGLSVYFFSAQGLLRRLAAPADWLKVHSSLARNTGRDNYEIEAASLRARAEDLERAGARAEGLLRAMLERESKALSKRAEALKERSLLYSEPPSARPKRFGRMLLHGRYRSRNLGGLGFWSLAKDCHLTFFGQGSAKGPENQPPELAKPLEGGS